MAMSIMELTSVGSDMDMVRSIMPTAICMLVTGKRIRLMDLENTTTIMGTCKFMRTNFQANLSPHVAHLSKLTFSFGVVLSSNFNNIQ